MDDDWLAWCPETLKWMGLRMLEECEARMLFHSWCVECVVEDGRIDSVIIESKAGRHAIKAKVVVDCTGDADIAALAGAPFAQGDENGEMIGVTMMFMMSDLDEEKFKSGKPLVKPPRHMGSRLTSIYPGHLNVWGGRIGGIDGINPWDLTKAENELRNQVFEWAAWAKQNMPGCENAYISMTSPQLGVRETRRIVGEYWLSKSDWDAKTIFPDHIGFAYVDRSIPYGAILPQEVTIGNNQNLKVSFPTHKRQHGDFTRSSLSDQQKSPPFQLFLSFEADSSLIPFPFSITSSFRIYTP